MKHKFSRKDWLKIFETLIDNDCSITSDREFRKHLTRDENLLANQLTREGTNNVADRSVDFDITPEMLENPELFFERIDQSKYADLVLRRAIVSIKDQLEKQGITADSE